jgi:hypothetical protein
MLADDDHGRDRTDIKAFPTALHVLTLRTGVFIVILQLMLIFLVDGMLHPT